MLHAKKIIVFVVCIFLVQLLSAQSGYIMHTLKPGESLSALAKQYNTSVGNIMRLNGMHADAKLVYGSKIKIPSTKNQTEVVKKNSTIINTSPAKTPSNEITHVVMKGETLYSISKKYNINVEQIKAWNHLADDNAKVGTLLVISDNGITKIATSSQKQRVETTTASTQQTNTPAVNNNQDIKTETSTVQDTKIDIENSAAQPSIQTTNNSTDLAINQSANYTGGGGYFQSHFKDKKARQTQTISGISKTFKTASGWSDGKYYILANDIEPGTIVKITADNGNTVYAKVLWNMGDLKENSGVNFRVSNATAAALHEDASSFNLNVSF